MGIDIHMSIVKNKEYIAEDIFDGRNSEWFGNLQKEGWENEYDELPARCGYSDQSPADYILKYTTERYYYGFFFINVKDFKDWFIKYRPDKDACWVTTYDKWRIENKGYIPENPQHYLSCEDNINDMHFVEIENIYDCSKWLYNYLIDNHISDDADIIYCFDR